MMCCRGLDHHTYGEFCFWIKPEPGPVKNDILSREVGRVFNSHSQMIYVDLVDRDGHTLPLTSKDARALASALLRAADHADAVEGANPVDTGLEAYRSL